MKEHFPKLIVNTKPQNKKLVQRTPNRIYSKILKITFYLNFRKPKITKNILSNRRGGGDLTSRGIRITSTSY